MDFFDSDIKFLKGVGEARAKLLNKLGIYTIEDLVYYFPRGYEDRTKISYIFETVIDEFACVCAMVCSGVTVKKIRTNMIMYKFKVADESGVMQVTLFNQKYLAASVKQGDTYVFSGVVSGNFTKREMTSPNMEKVHNESAKRGRIVPLYPLTAGIGNAAISKLIKTALTSEKAVFNELINNEIITKYKLCDLKTALYEIHFPTDMQNLDKAKQRLVFEEFLIYSLGLFMLKKSNLAKKSIQMKQVDLTEFTNALPFELTNAQLRVINECVADITGKTCMNRLVQGDVGSGKTVVAASVMYMVARNGCQSVMMAPTEILATQHFNTLKKLFGHIDIRIALLTGSTPKKARKQILSLLESGEIDILVGTHAVISGDVVYNKLALAITDEQHRFGTAQRGKLSKKGEGVHTLVMSATPIPRTLALITYGDLDISIIDSLPPGRKKIETLIVDSSMRDRYLGFIKKEIENGRQAYIVCPMIDATDSSELLGVLDYYNSIKEKYFKNTEIAIMHGKLKPKEKDNIMNGFANGEIKLLVSTTVIEVGVNVPNATVMLIENAQRFGLSQLHQLRGRVGRGAEKSWCILSSDSKGESAKERLMVMHDSNDGFYISQKDLQLRGPGEFFGTKQHGAVKLKIADIIDDVNVLCEAQQTAREILNMDSRLQNGMHAQLKKRVHKLFMRPGDISSN